MRKLKAELLDSELTLEQKCACCDLSALLKDANYPAAFFKAEKLLESLVDSAEVKIDYVGTGWFSAVSMLPYLLDGLAYVCKIKESEFAELAVLFSTLVDHLEGKQNEKIRRAYAVLVVFACRYHIKANAPELAKALLKNKRWNLLKNCM